MSKRAKDKAERIANGIMISVQGKTGRVVYNTKEKSFTHYELMCAAQKGYSQAESDTIERACDWLFAHLPILVDYYNEDIHENADRSDFIKLFRKQMEEE